MGDGNDHGIIITLPEFANQVDPIFFVSFVGAGPRVVNIHIGAITFQLINDVNHPGIANVRAVFLKRQTKDQDVRLAHMNPPTVHQLD